MMFMVFFMIDLHNLSVKILAGVVHAAIRDATIIREAHGFLVWVLLAVDAAVAVGAAMVVGCHVIVNGIVTAANVNIEVEFHALFIALGKKESLRVAAAPARAKIKSSSSGNGFIGVVDQLGEGDSVRNGHVGVVGMTLDVVVTGI